MMICMWLFGDMYKVSYYESKGSPAQLVFCSFFACMVDCAILSQFWIYRKLTAEETLKNKEAIVAASDTESVRESTTEVTISENSESVEEKGIELSGRLTLQRRNSSSGSPVEKGAVSPVRDQ